MAIKPFVDGVSCLAYILFLAFITSDAIYQIIALAGHVASCRVFPFSVGAGDSARSVDEGAVFAINMLAFIFELTAWNFVMACFDLW